MWRSAVAILAILAVAWVILIALHIVLWLFHILAAIAAALVVGYAIGYVEGRASARRKKSDAYKSYR